MSKSVQVFLAVATIFMSLSVSARAEVYTQTDYWPFYAGLSWTFNVSGEEWLQPVGGEREESSFTDVPRMIRLVAEDMEFNGHDGIRKEYDVEWQPTQFGATLHGKMRVDVWYCHQNLKLVAVAYFYPDTLSTDTLDLVNSIHCH